MASRGLVVAGLTSGSGKTTVTLGLLRAMQHAGIAVNAAKSGPCLLYTSDAADE